MIDPAAAHIWKIEDLISEIPQVHLEKEEKLYGKLSPQVYQNPVANLQWDYLFFKDSSIFQPAADAYRKSKEAARGSSRKATYTPYLKGTRSYREFWKQERERCIHGYEPEINGNPCGIRISGEHYFYLNFCPIGRVGIDENTGLETEVVDFPMFCAMDYYWFLELEARENPKRYNLPAEYRGHIILAKARRKGWSYKNAAGAVWKYSFVPNSKVLIVSETGEKSADTFEKCLSYIDFLTDYTEFGGPTIYRNYQPKKAGGIKAGVKAKKSGAERGRRSVIETVTLFNKPHSASGKGCARVIFEEAGEVKRLKEAWAFTEPTLRSGKFLKGIAIIFGTGGDMDGATQDFADMFYQPTKYKLKGYKNIYETGAKGQCGLFIADMWFREGATFTNLDGASYDAVDANGNSRHWVAEIDLNIERIASKGKDKKSYNTDLTQYCKTPSEAFLVPEGNIFPTAELYQRLSRLTSNNEFRLLGTVGELITVKGETKFKPDLEGKLQPIQNFPLKETDDHEGALVIYEHPIEIHGLIPNDAYIVTIDPIGIDAEGGQSLASILVLKSCNYPFEMGHDEVVAEWTGRPKLDPMDTIHNILLKLSRYYNAQATHENDRAGKAVREYFIKHNEFHRLMKPPAYLIGQFMGTSRTLQRQTGHSMGAEKLKEMGEIYTNQWLREERKNPYTGDTETNLDLLSSKPLIKELIQYNRKGNFDRVLSLMGGIIQMRNHHKEFIEKAKDVDQVMDYFISKMPEHIRNRKNAISKTKTTTEVHEQKQTMASGQYELSV